MEIMEDGNLVDRVRILLQRDMQYYQVVFYNIILYYIIFNVIKIIFYKIRKEFIIN